MKRVILFLLSALMILGLAACGGTGEEDPNKVLNVPENYTLVRTEEATGVTVHGISVEFDPLFSPKTSPGAMSGRRIGRS